MEPTMEGHRSDGPWTLAAGDSPILGTAIHDGHQLRDEVLGLTALDEATRLREEDPHTGFIASVAPNHLVPQRSRFEVDLNRPRDAAVYLEPADAWGLDLWHSRPTEQLVSDSLATYDAFYAHLREILDRLVAAHGGFVVLDVHSYNHRRQGPDGPAEDPEGNPEVNVGTGSLDRARWGPIVDGFMDDLRDHSVSERRLDVRENIRFRGGHMSRWIHQHYPDTGCALAIEFKKTFMDEWTGDVDDAALGSLRDALAHTLPGLVEQLGGA